ncbi:MAG: SMP-30/gluconolactonase/LRE family protein [Candidatus Dormiibacterota bacterium]
MIGSEESSSVVRLAPGVNSGIGESPFWDLTRDAFVWVDIASQEVRRIQPQTGQYEAWSAGQHIGAVLPRASGGMVVALGDGFGAFDPSDGSIQLLAPLDVGDVQVRLNDCQCDALGRIWGGTEGQPLHSARLYRLEADHSLAEVVTGISVSNGIGWSPDNRLMYYIDSPERRVDVFDYDLSRGEIANRRPFVVIPNDFGIPDGLCVDEDGMVWVALFGGAALARYSTKGELDRKVAVPALNVTSCSFGGADLSSLLITTASIGMTAVQQQQYPDAGGLFVYHPGVRGKPPNAYAG